MLELNQNIKVILRLADFEIADSLELGIGQDNLRRVGFLDFDDSQGIVVVDEVDVFFVTGGDHLFCVAD